MAKTITWVNFVIQPSYDFNDFCPKISSKKSSWKNFDKKLHNVRMNTIPRIFRFLIFSSKMAFLAKNSMILMILVLKWSFEAKIKNEKIVVFTLYMVRMQLTF